MTLDEWGAMWFIPPEAMTHLKYHLGMIVTDPQSTTATGELDLQNKIRLEASRKGLRLFRNNIGATYDVNGNFIRYGLANESKKLNQKIKSSDLIGVRPVLIDARHLGHTVGQFVAREVKRPGWRYTGSGRESAQLAFIELIASLGGDAAFVSEEGRL